MVRWWGFEGFAGLFTLGLASASCATILGIDKDCHPFVDESGGDAADGEACAAGSDCQSRVCTNQTCRAPTCADSVANGAETGVDCGGPSCPACAGDEACIAGFTCVPTPTPGWNGPVALYTGDPAGKPDACPPAYPTQVYQGNSGIVNTAAICTPCTCDAPTVSCTASQLLFKGAPLCTTNYGSTNLDELNLGVWKRVQYGGNRGA